MPCYLSDWAMCFELFFLQFLPVFMLFECGSMLNECRLMLFEF